jgi:flagellar export protein FliJ
MKGLPTLIRVRGWELEEKRRELARREAHAARIADEIQAIDASVAHEMRVAGGDTQVIHAYGPFARAAIDLRRQREVELERAMAQVDAAAEEVTVAYQELKKLEVAQENHERRMAEEAARREQVRLDEIAIEKFRRSEST